MNECEAIRATTTMLRTSHDAFWPTLRELLSRRGIAPEAAALLFCWSEDVDVVAGELAFLATTGEDRLRAAYFELDLSKDDLAEWRESPWSVEPPSNDPEVRSAVMELVGIGLG